MAETALVTAEASGDVTNGSDNCHVTCVRECVVSNKINDDVIASNQNEYKSFYDADDRLSACPTPSEDETMGLEERPSSALSCSSAKGSRIPVPRLCRSSSVRHGKNKSSNEDHSAKDINHNRTTPILTGLQRSQSFATSRGMAGLTSSAGSTLRSRAPLTPDLKRKKATSYTPSSYVSPYSMKVISSERKSQNSCAGSELSEVDNEDNLSERSFSSASVHGCCDKDHIRSGAGLWGGRRPKNILHCSHAHDQHDPDDYLTPTQKAARKIRDLTAELKKARREIFEKDTKISVLTRDLVELRIEKASRKNSLEVDYEELKDETSGNMQKSKSSKHRSKFHRSVSMDDKVPNLSIRSFSPSGDASCVSPPSVGNNTAGDLITKSEAPPSPVEASIGDSDSGDLCRSLADSGHYEDQDLHSPCLSPRESLDISRSSGRKIRDSFCSENDDSERRIWSVVNSADENIQHNEFSRRIEALKENHMEEYQELKERYNDRVEMLLSKLSDSNLKYFEFRPLYDKSLEKIRELEKTNEKLKQELHESELRQQKIYLQMYLKGQQAAKLEAEGQISSRRSSESEMEKTLSDVEKTDQDSVLNDTIVISLMRQLTLAEKEIDKLKTLYNEEINRTNRSRSNSTFGLRREEIDPAITLQFLKSAIYYFLTDRENAQGHLRAIESILGYSSMERGQINKHVKI